MAPHHRRGPAPVAGGPGRVHPGGAPWFDYYDQDAEDLAPTDTLGAVQPVGDWLGDDHEPWQAPAPGQVEPLKDAQGKPVEDGDW